MNGDRGVRMDGGWARGGVKRVRGGVRGEGWDTTWGGEGKGEALVWVLDVVSDGR